MARVAILLADEFEDAEFRAVADVLLESGDDAIVVSARRELLLRGREGREEARAEASYTELFPEQFHGLVIPGGPSASTLIDDEDAVAFVRHFFLTGRPLAAIGTAAELLIPARVAAGCTLTSAPRLAPDLEAAGAKWLDVGVATSHGGHLITGQGQSDLDRLADAFLHCLRGAEAQTSPREAPPETPPLD